MKLGDRVRIIKIPSNLPDDDMRTKELFERCLGRTFAVVGHQGGLLELEVGQVLGEKAYMHSIWVEPELVEVVDGPHD